MAERKHVPFVSSETNMVEFTLRSLIIGLVLTVILGAANTYLGLKAGMTIAATYPAAVIGMALLRIMKGTVLEENFIRTVGSIGSSIAGATIFVIPAFYLAGIWARFDTVGNYLVTSVILFAGGLLGIMFVSLLRRVMVEETELKFPESIAASEIHKAGRTGGTGAKFLFSAMGIGALIYSLGQFNFYATTWQKFVSFAKASIDLKSAGTAAAQGGLTLNAPAVSPAFIGVGYIIGPKLSSLVFSGGLLSWGLLVPIILYFLSPGLIAQWTQAHAGQAITANEWINWSVMIWKSIVRPIAVGGMITGIAFTLFKMRKNLSVGLKRSITDVKKAASGEGTIDRVEKDVSFKLILSGIAVAGVICAGIFYYFTQNLFAAIILGIVVVFIGFLFAAIAGYLTGIIGSSNNPVSGITLSALVITSLLIVGLGLHGQQGVAAALAIAAVICTSSVVAGDALQDLKAGHLLGGTPWRMQIGDVIGIAVASAVMFLPLIVLHQGDINVGKMAAIPYEGGFGSATLAAPQAGLMALVSSGIIGGQMAWPLIIVGIFLGIGFVLMQVRSPMLASIGMYLPLSTTFAMFIGGMIKQILENRCEAKKFSDGQKTNVENTGILLASGLIAGEALTGLIFAVFAFLNVKIFSMFDNPSFLVSILVLIFIGWYLVRIPLKNARSKMDEDTKNPPISA